MILKNKLTREILEITYLEFRKKFAKEIQNAFESYHKTQLNKYSYNLKDDNSMEFNFYFELHWKAKKSRIYGTFWLYPMKHRQARLLTGY